MKFKFHILLLDGILLWASSSNHDDLLILPPRIPSNLNKCPRQKKNCKHSHMNYGEALNLQQNLQFVHMELFKINFQPYFYLENFCVIRLMCQENFKKTRRKFNTINLQAVGRGLRNPCRLVLAICIS